MQHLRCSAHPQVGNVLTFKLLRRPRRSIIPIEAEPDAAAAHQRPQKASTLWILLSAAEHMNSKQPRGHG